MLSWVVLVAITTATKPRQGGLNGKYLFLMKLDSRGWFPAGCCAELLGRILFWHGLSACSVFTGERGVETEKENLCSLLSIGIRFLSESSALSVRPSFPGLACRPHCTGDWGITVWAGGGTTNVQCLVNCFSNQKRYTYCRVEAITHEA